MSGIAVSCGGTEREEIGRTLVVYTSTVKYDRPHAEEIPDAERAAAAVPEGQDPSARGHRRRPLGRRRPAALGGRAGRAVRGQPHDGQPRAARAEPGRADRAAAGRGHFRRAVAPHLVHPDRARRARRDRRARSSARSPAAPARDRAGHARTGGGLRAQARCAAVPQRDRPSRERQGDPVRGPARQPGLRAGLPDARFRPDDADALPARGCTLVRGAVHHRIAAAVRTGGPVARHRQARALPGRQAPYLQPRADGDDGPPDASGVLVRSRREFPSMSWSVVCANDVAPQRWKNDGGWTRELLAWPHPADWALRISVADIEADGPFSAFEGVQRWFAVLAGAGVRLYEYELRAGDELLA